MTAGTGKTAIHLMDPDTDIRTIRKESLSDASFREDMNRRQGAVDSGGHRNSITLDDPRPCLQQGTVVYV
jgi:hypothetical protein